MTVAIANNNGQAQRTAWGIALYDPTEARPSDAHPEWGPQHSLLVQRDEEQLRIYFKPGLLSYIQAGDAILLEYRKGKWRTAFNQPPELLNELQERQEASPLEEQYEAWSMDCDRPAAALMQPRQQQQRLRSQPQQETADNLALKTMADDLLQVFRYMEVALPGREPNLPRSLAITCWIEWRKLQRDRKEEPAF